MLDKKINPTLAGNGAYQKSQAKNTTISCNCCGYKFAPSQTAQRLCGQCLAYARTGSHMQLAARLLRGVRS